MSTKKTPSSFDLYRLFAKLGQGYVLPLARQLAVRVTRRGFYLIASWAMWVIVTSLIGLLIDMPVIQQSLGNADTRLVETGFHALTVLFSLVLALGLLWDYVALLRVTRQLFSKSVGKSMDLTIRRETHSNLSAQAWSTVKLWLTLANPSAKKMPFFQLTLTDNYPLLASTEQLPISFDSQVFNRSITHNESNLTTPQLAVSYQLFAHERGMARFDGVDMLVQGKLGWLKKFVTISEHDIVGSHDARVLANFADIAQGQLAGVSRQVAVSGMLKQRRRGQGQDFHQIRNYSEGDSIRHLDWKATARYQRLMTREYQDERDQQIIFLLDCGQHMRHMRFFDPTHDEAVSSQALSQGSHLDQALNAMLLLADVANQQGDATGFISFAGENNKIIAPKKGGQVISYLLNQSFDLQPSDQLPDYLAVARQVRQVQKKRALLILITNTRQEESSELAEAIRLLSAKHVVILANLYEQDLADYLAKPPIDVSQALTYHTVKEYMNVRERLHAELGQQTHVHCINTTPQNLPKRLIQQYFLIKQRHRL